VFVRRDGEVRVWLWPSRNTFPIPKNSLVTVQMARFFTLRGRRDNGEVTDVLEALHAGMLQKLDRTRDGVCEISVVNR